LRQQQLENLGWQFHRIWPTDWFLRREDEVRRALAAFEAAVAHADTLDRDGLHPQRPAPAPVPNRAPPRTRGPRPPVPPGRSIDAYSPQDLRALVQWVLSDGKLPTDDEIVTELTRELGFQRRGAKIVAALMTAIRTARG